MSGGGSSKKKKDTAAPTTPYDRAPVAQTFQPTLPGFQNMMAQQLSQGFGSGGGSPDFAGMLSSMYRPMDLFRFQEPISTTADRFDKKKFAPIETGNPALDTLLMGGNIGKKKKDD